VKVVAGCAGALAMLTGTAPAVPVRADARVHSVPHPPLTGVRAAIARTGEAARPTGDRFGNMPMRRPYTRGTGRVTGLLLAYNPATGRNVTCGASVLRSRSRSLVLTAAHCLFDNHGRRGRWFEDALFVPAYNSAGRGDAPFGVWPVQRAFVPRQWRTRVYSPQALPYDVGLARVASPGADHRKLEQVVGQGLRPRLNRRGAGFAKVRLLGYPADLRYRGTDMYRCVGDAVEAGAPGPGMLLTRACRLVSGGSGGPAVHRGRVVGVASSSSPYRDHDGFSLITRLGPGPFARLLARADGDAGRPAGRS
jgi:V8-like Glu-specific endopeptidase